MAAKAEAHELSLLPAERGVGAGRATMLCTGHRQTRILNTFETG